MKRILLAFLITITFVGAFAQVPQFGPPNWATSVPDGTDRAQVVRQSPSDLWRCSFASVGSGVISPEMSLLQTGSGMTVNQSGGNLVITTGTTNSSETVIRSTRTFSGAYTMRHKITLSQRITGNLFAIELADLVGEGLSYTINSATSVTVTFATNPFTSANVGQSMNLSMITGAAGIPGKYAIASVSGSTVTYTVAGWPASGSGTLMIWGWNYNRVQYTGTTATTTQADAQRKGWGSGYTSLTTVTSASPGHIIQTETDNTMVAYSDALAASATTMQFTSRGSRLENLPEPTDELYLFITIQNTATPASTTTATIGFTSVEIHGNNKVFLAGATPNGSGFAVPAVIVQPAAVTQSGTFTVMPGNTANTTAWLVEQRTGTTNGSTTTAVNSAATTNAAFLKASAGMIYYISAMNTSAAIKYVRIFNKTSAPTMGTDVPILVIAIPAGESKEIPFSSGLKLATGIAYAITNAAAVLDATAVAAGDVQLLINWN